MFKSTKSTDLIKETSNKVTSTGINLFFKSMGPIEDDRYEYQSKNIVMKNNKDTKRDTTNIELNIQHLCDDCLMEIISFLNFNGHNNLSLTSKKFNNYMNSPHYKNSILSEKLISEAIQSIKYTVTPANSMNKPYEFAIPNDDAMRFAKLYMLCYKAGCPKKQCNDILRVMFDDTINLLKCHNNYCISYKLKDIDSLEIIISQLSKFDFLNENAVKILLGTIDTDIELDSCTDDFNTKTQAKITIDLIANEIKNFEKERINQNDGKKAGRENNKKCCVM